MKTIDWYNRGHEFEFGDMGLHWFVNGNSGTSLERCSWMNALDKISDDQSIYIRSAIRKGQSLLGKPQVKLSTIHGSKGHRRYKVSNVGEWIENSFRLIRNTLWIKNCPLIKSII